jgi:hypothetical protein
MKQIEMDIQSVPLLITTRVGSEIVELYMIDNTTVVVMTTAAHVALAS